MPSLPSKRASSQPLLFLVVLLLAGLVVGCRTAPQNDSDWLYHALGERKGIAAISETFVLGIAADDRISGIFEDTDIVRFHHMITDHTCVVAGGPCTYTGDNMVDAHRGLGLTSADFNAVVENLILSMEQHEIPVAAQNALLARLAPMRDDITGEHPLPTQQAGMQAH